MVLETQIYMNPYGEENIIDDADLEEISDDLEDEHRFEENVGLQLSTIIQSKRSYVNFFGGDSSS